MIDAPVLVAYDVVLLDSAGAEVSERLRTAFVLLDERRLTLAPARGPIWFRDLRGVPSIVSVRTLPDYGGREIRRMALPTAGGFDLG